MPSCMDVYVWVPAPSPEVLMRFIDSYVAGDWSEEQRLSSFQRIYVLGTGTEEDARLLAEVNWPAGSGAFTLYLKARAYAGATLTMTLDGAAVFGLSFDDPDPDISPDALVVARQLIHKLRTEFDSPAGIAGAEMPPPHSHAGWFEEYQVQVREGEPPPVLGGS